MSNAYAIISVILLILFTARKFTEINSLSCQVEPPTFSAHFFQTGPTSGFIFIRMIHFIARSHSLLDLSRYQNFGRSKRDIKEPVQIQGVNWSVLMAFCERNQAKTVEASSFGYNSKKSAGINYLYILRD